MIGLAVSRSPASAAPRSYGKPLPGLGATSRVALTYLDARPFCRAGTRRSRAT